VSNSDLTSILFILLALVGLAQLFGYLFVRLRQPKVVGEISQCGAGPADWPIALGVGPMEAIRQQANILNFIYWLGLLLPIPSKCRGLQLFTREERREVSWLVIGTGIPLSGWRSVPGSSPRACRFQQQPHF
jgi:hypothetical protein